MFSVRFCGPQGHIRFGQLQVGIAFSSNFKQPQKSKIETLLEDFISIDWNQAKWGFHHGSNVSRLERIMESFLLEQIKHNESMHYSIKALVVKMEKMAIHQKMLETQIANIVPLWDILRFLKLQRKRMRK